MIKLCKRFLFCIYHAGDRMVDHDGIEHAGYLAFLLMLGFFPFMVILAAFAALLGESSLGQEFVALLMEYLPEESTKAILPRINEIVSGPPQGLLTIAILGALWTASSGLEGLRTTLNRAFAVNNPPPYLWRRISAIVQLLFITGLLLAILAILITIPLAYIYLREYIPLLPNHVTYLSEINLIIGFLVMLLAVMLLYDIIPNAKLPWILTLSGALMTVFLWTISGYIFSYYLSHTSQLTLIYGSLAGIIATLLFFYVISLGIIYGAEFSYQLSKWLKIDFKSKE
jgi:membrane protein